MERMVGHATGMIGLPLRLLAREVYDRLTSTRSPDEVALVTGEERIIPPKTRYWVCTVEAMPLSVPVAFLAVDEVQLAADPERGHTFTDRILNARGTKETMFLGADTMGPMLRKTIPGIRIERRQRLSKLSFGGHTKLSRLPRRSAVIAYRADDVYGIAEQLRRQKGGAAVVMGALSPRTRNAQVQLFEDGEVDYLVATDAIGMGLNLSIDHIAFASLRKFDGQQERRLVAPEIGQVAGRAGRHLNHGTFGTTGDAPPFDDEIVTAVETHSYRPIPRVRYRNADIDLSSVPGLLTSLEAPPRAPHFQPALEAADIRSLRSLYREPDIAKAVRSPSKVSLLWQVCTIPDFQQMLHETHTNLLGSVFRALNSRSGRLPVDLLAKNIQHLDRTSGDIDTLQNRLAHIRTWTYIAHQTEWVTDAVHWQERARAVEDRLSEALHERLTQRFVDRHHVATLRRLRATNAAVVFVDQDGGVLIDDALVGRIRGLHFVDDRNAPRFDRKVIRRELTENLERKASAMLASDDATFDLSDGEIRWNGAPIAVLVSGEHVLGPTVRLSVDECLHGRPVIAAVQARLTGWITRHIEKTLSPLLQVAHLTLRGAARGLIYQLTEHFGVVSRADVRDIVEALSKADRRELSRHGVKIGRFFVFVPSMFKQRRTALSFQLARLVHGPSLAPPEGRVSFDLTLDHKVPTIRACGFQCVGDRAIRVDALERLGQVLASKKGVVTVDHTLLSLVGSPRQAFPAVMRFVGYRPNKSDSDTYRRAPARSTHTKKVATSPFSVLEEMQIRTNGVAPS